MAESERICHSVRIETFCLEAIADFCKECFHMTLRRPYWCPKTMKQWPCWCPKLILWELNSFLMQTLSFVPIHLHRYWPREWKHSIVLGPCENDFLWTWDVFPCSMTSAWFWLVYHETNTKRPLQMKVELESAQGRLGYKESAKLCAHFAHRFLRCNYLGYTNCPNQVHQQCRLPGMRMSLIRNPLWDSCRNN